MLGKCGLGVPILLGTNFSFLSFSDSPQFYIRRATIVSAFLCFFVVVELSMLVILYNLVIKDSLLGYLGKNGLLLHLANLCIFIGSAIVVLTIIIRQKENLARNWPNNVK